MRSAGKQAFEERSPISSLHPKLTRKENIVCPGGGTWVIVKEQHEIYLPKDNSSLVNTLNFNQFATNQFEH